MTLRDKLAVKIAWLINLNPEKKDRTIKRLRGKKPYLYAITSRQFQKAFFCLRTDKDGKSTTKFVIRQAAVGEDTPNEVLPNDILPDGAVPNETVSGATATKNYKARLNALSASYRTSISNIISNIRSKTPPPTIEIYSPKQKTGSKIVYYIHGGGFIAPLTAIHRQLHSILSRVCGGAAIAFIDYRTAPAHIYPAAHDDAVEGYEFLLKQGYSSQDIIIMGDSAGGNLAISLLLKLRDEGKELPLAAVTFSAWTDLTASSQSYRDNYGSDAVFGRKGIENDLEERRGAIMASSLYSYAGEHDRTDPKLSPFFAEFHDLPPILMIAGEKEMPLDDTLLVAKKIEDAGGIAEVVIGKGMFHVYPLLHSLSPIAKQAFNEIERFITKVTKVNRQTDDQ